MEVLRLVIVDGQMELRFCGARVVLGPVASAGAQVQHTDHRSG
jgi:hypothetical protein